MSKINRSYYLTFTKTEPNAYVKNNSTSTKKLDDLQSMQLVILQKHLGQQYPWTYWLLHVESNQSIVTSQINCFTFNITCNHTKLAFRTIVVNFISDFTANTRGAFPTHAGTTCTRILIRTDPYHNQRLAIASDGKTNLRLG